jgi:hypothetical protein
MDARITFPYIFGAEFGEDRFEVARLHPPFRAMGEATLSALATREWRFEGSAAIEFLAGVSEFIAGKYGAERDGREGEIGDHEYACDLNGQQGLAVARGINRLANNPFSRITVGYASEAESDKVSVVDIGLQYASHPRLRHAFARFACSDTSYMGRQSGGLPSYDITLSAAFGDITHSGRIVPDQNPSLHLLAAVGKAISPLRGRTPS